MNLHDIEQLLEDNREMLTNWMNEQRQQVPIPIYGSVDIRDSGWKIASVDANHFPAGFNNVAEEDEPYIAGLLDNHLQRRHAGCKWIHLYPESQTRNPAYVENVATIQRLIIKAGYECTVGSPELNGLGTVNGLTSPLHLVSCEAVKNPETGDEDLLVEGKSPCLILLNNDLTGGLVPGIGVQDISPPINMGWHRRRKSEHYDALLPYVEQVSEMLGIDSWHLMPSYFVSKDKCLDRESCRIELAAEVDEFLDNIRQKYAELGIDREAVAFVKNDRGTYGLGIMVVKQGQDLLNLSNRKMKRLMYSKGGADVENFLIQEGVPTMHFTEDGSPIEPVVYLVDGQAASWFYRINAKKGDMDNLNSPSATFVKLADMEHPITEQAKGWHELIAELSMLAMGAEHLHAIEASE